MQKYTKETTQVLKPFTKSIFTKEKRHFVDQDNQIKIKYLDMTANMKNDLYCIRDTFY